MNEYIFYTNEGFTLLPNGEDEVENCQLLGSAFGSNINEARCQLKNQCAWIEEYGFSINNATARQLLSEENRKDIKTIVEYLTEVVDRNDAMCESSNNHIEKVLMRLKNLIY